MQLIDIKMLSYPHQITPYKRTEIKWENTVIIIVLPNKRQGKPILNIALSFDLIIDRIKSPLNLRQELGM